MPPNAANQSRQRLAGSPNNGNVEIAASDGYTTNQLIAKLYDELLDYRGEIDNFASFLRVSCLRYLTLRKSAADKPVIAIVGRSAA